MHEAMTRRSGVTARWSSLFFRAADARVLAAIAEVEESPSAIHTPAATTWPPPGPA